ncbi:MAG: ComF family protein, partial [Chitinophagaceae bacterium]
MMQQSTKIGKEFWRGLSHLWLPQLCEGCRQPLHASEKVLCLSCFQELPFVHFHDDPLNAVTVRIAGRIPFQHASAFALFSGDGLLQHLLHRLKYNRRKEIGDFLGRQAAYGLQDSNWVEKIEGIVPVPLHGKKQAWRGFNQTEVIAKGMAEVLAVPVFEKLLIRTRKTESQTTKTREEREENVRDAFALSKSYAEFGNAERHLLLIDDVLTTGATLEA